MHIKILHIIHWPRSGITSLIRDSIRIYAENNYEISIILLNGESVDYQYFNEASNVYILGFSKNPYNAAKKLRRVLNSINPDIVHAHSFLPYLLTCVIKKRKTKMLSTVHNEYPYFSGRDFKSTMKRIIHRFFIKIYPCPIIVVSPSIVPLIEKLDRSFRDIHVIKNGVPFKNKVSDEQVVLLKKRYGVVQRDIIFVTVGRLSPEKNYLVLIKAFSSIVEKNRHAKLFIVGDGPERNGLMREIEARCLENNIKLVGYSENPQKFLSLSDIYVNSSIFEGLNLSILEAMREGLPVIVTPVGASPELIINKKNGVLLKNTSEESLKVALEDAINGDYDLKMIGEEGNKLYMDEYQIEKYAAEHMKIYNETMS